ncbi:tetrathionate reductase subunit TtrB [Lonepinella koalarum]|uniref:Tetrathionate reductase beta subunit n=1 Tax=Lonepinella koalarum TaxID=53417 RepID=A0A4R1L0U4_9PAST|nr:tetrathionate reductase subunit TtrB [Lonepinella koalarum]MDH2926831.1 tetrathionate reductase subunit B [Lonepinella koalarum]TCK70510.1 tetrathionate reductase beta subunit [Lonepinella koalarum]TFJ90108.1 tetrathionate reductase subunit TtrB [Lonepinella koalarum]TYG33799.1 tetrathionate reductase subunit TtrB [Lonepinella koalarum]
MELTKRKLLKNFSALTVGSAFVPLSYAEQNFQPARREGSAEHRYGMLIDLRRCIGCQACTVSCSVENNSPLGEFRTTVRQYEVVNENHMINNVLLPRLCNHCDNPPCVPVCPVQATYQRKDGIVVINNEACIGCAYCVQACPYDARFINEETKTADKCTFCAHRLEAGLLPACVESCVGGARIIGDLKDPNSTISQLIAQHKDELKVLKPEDGTIPQVFYLGLDDAFVSQVKGQPMLWQGLEDAA